MFSLFHPPALTSYMKTGHQRRLLGWHLLGVLITALVVLTCVALLPHNLANAQTPTNTSAAGQGVLESVTVNPDRSITLNGWAVSNRPDVFVTYARVWLDDRLLYQGRLGYASHRSDVAQSLGNPLWEISGFSLPLRVPNTIPAGLYTVRMEVMLGDQSRFDVEPLPGQATLSLPPPPASPSLRAKALFWLALALPLLVWLISPWRSAQPVSDQSYFGAKQSKDESFSPQGLRIFALACLASFVLLVTGGWTGSSLPRLLNQTPMIEHNASIWLGQAQDVRSDEWQVVTPLAISQIYGPQRFASVNSLHGQPGQNLHVVGMTGVPIANAAAIAKPATWGFFFLDLRRALAWDWWLPFFACFGAVLGLLQRWFSPMWELNALLAASVAFSGYSVSWSGWPAYVTFFPVAAVLAGDTLLRARHWFSALSASVLLGWASAGFVFVLYPGWQIPLGYLMALLALAALWQYRNKYRCRSPQVLGLLLAVGIVALLLAAWWLDASEAIQTVRNTVYPGQRSLDLGGYADPWHLSKGLGNAVTLYSASQWSIASDAGNFIYVLPPLLVASLIVWSIQRRIDAISLVLWAFIAFVCCYLFWGLPAWLSRASLWSMVPAFRLDVALGLAQTFLLAWLLQQWQTIKANANSAFNAHTFSISTLLLRAAGAFGAILFVYSTAQQFGSMLSPLQSWLSPGLIGLIYAACTALAYMLITGKMQAAILLYGGWTLATALPFNPIGQAPSTINTTTAMAQAMQQHPQGQVAVVGQKEWSNALTSAGISVLNSTFYEPPLAFWKQLDPQQEYIDQYNRYQHLDIYLSEDDSLNSRHFSVGAPRMDRVSLRLHPKEFDFNLLNVQFVLTNAAEAPALNGNLSLQRIAEEPHSWVLFQVIPHSDSQLKRNKAILDVQP